MAKIRQSEQKCLRIKLRMCIVIDASPDGDVVLVTRVTHVYLLKGEDLPYVIFERHLLGYKTFY